MSRSGDESFREIQRLAREQAAGNTQAILEQFVHERFLARLASSQYVERFVLKGGMLLAVWDLRRATRDADVMIRDLALEEDELTQVLREILAINLDDGVDFDRSPITSREIREGAQYTGIRFSLDAHVGSANVKFKLDVNAGDPVEAVKVTMPTLLQDGQFELNAYPIESVLAEKGETLISRGDANTRMKDFADIYLIATRHSIQMTSIRRALLTTAAYRRSELVPLSEALVNIGQLRQADWKRFVEQSQLAGVLPPDLGNAIALIELFFEPVIAGIAATAVWDPGRTQWIDGTEAPQTTQSRKARL